MFVYEFVRVIICLAVACFFMYSIFSRLMFECTNNCWYFCVIFISLQVPVDVHVFQFSKKVGFSTLQHRKYKCCAAVFIPIVLDMKLHHKSTDATFPCLPIQLSSYISWGFGSHTTVGLYNHINKTRDTLPARTIKKETKLSGKKSRDSILHDKCHIFKSVATV